MGSRRVLTVIASTVMTLGLLAGPVSADHTKGKKFRDVSLTRAAAIEAGDPFGVAPEGSSASGALYLNHGKNRFCAFLDFEIPTGFALVALHVHEKAPGTMNGPVVIDLSSTIDGSSAGGCVTAARDSLRGILSSPGDYYVNAHIDDTTTAALELTVVRTEFGHN